MTAPDYVVNGVHVRSLLGDLLHSENTTRRRAEAEWEQLVPMRGIAEALLSIATEGGEVSADVTAMCFILIKNNLTKLCDEDLFVVQESILRVLAASRTASVSKLIASVAVGVAVTRGGGQWEHLYEVLWSMLSSPSSPSTDCSNVEDVKIANALLCVGELCAVLPADVLVSYVNLAPLLMTIGLNAGSEKSKQAIVRPLLGCSSAPSSCYAPVSQQQALRTLADMALVVGLGEEHTLTAVCVEAYSSLVAIGCCALENDVMSNRIAHEAMKIASIVGDFQPSVATAAAFMKVMHSLSASADVYNYVVLEPRVGVEGDVEDAVNRCTATRWDFISGFFRTKKRSAVVSELFAGAEDAISQQFAAVTLQYCGLGHQQRSDWILDPNAFLKGEDDRDDQVSTSVRDAASEACELLCKRGGVVIWVAVFERCSALLMADGTSSSWVEREAALFLLAELMHRRSAVVKTASSEYHARLLALTERVAAVDLTGGGSPASSSFLIARALLFFRTAVITFSPNSAVLPTDRIALQLLSPSVATLQSQDEVVVCAATLLLTRMIGRCPKSEVAAVGPTALPIILSLAARSSHELLYLLLELTLQWLRRCGPSGLSSPAMTSLTPSIPPALMAAWHAQLDDPNVAELVIDVKRYLLKHCPQSHAGFFPLLPWMASTLGGFESLTAMCSIPSVLSIVRDMVAYGEESLVAEVGNTLLGALCRLLLNSDDSGVTNAASNALASLLKRIGPAAVYNCTVPMPPSHFHTGAVEADALPPLDEEDEAVPVATAVNAIATKMLAQSTKEFTLLNAGGFFLELVPVVAAANALPQYLTSLVDRALTLQMDSTLQEVMLPIAAILHEHTHGALESLATTGRFVPLLEKWLPRQKYFFGRNVLLHTTLALSAVLAAVGSEGSSEIGAKNVRWGGSSGGTRKKAERVIPLRLAIFVTLGKQLDLALKSKAEEYRSESENDDDDLESLTDGEDAADYNGDEDEDKDDIDPNDCNRDPYAAAASDEGDDDEDREEIEEGKANSGRQLHGKNETKKGCSSKYFLCWDQFAAFVTSLGPYAADGGLFTSKEIERLKKRMGS